MHIHPIIKSALLSIVMSLVFFVLGCKSRSREYKDDFYNQWAADEAKLLPLKRPYLLSSIFSDPWKINLTDRKYPSTTNVDVLYMDDGCFWGYGKYGIATNNNYEFIKDVYSYFIIDFNSGTEYKFSDSLKYISKLKEIKKINPTMYSRSDLDSVYNQFSKNGILPWYNEK